MFGRRRAWTEHISTARAWRKRGIATAVVCASLRQLGDARLRGGRPRRRHREPVRRARPVRVARLRGRGHRRHDAAQHPLDHSVMTESVGEEGIRRTGRYSTDPLDSSPAARCRPAIVQQAPIALTIGYGLTAAPPPGCTSRCRWGSAGVAGLADVADELAGGDGGADGDARRQRRQVGVEDVRPVGPGDAQAVAGQRVGRRAVQLGHRPGHDGVQRRCPPWPRCRRRGGRGRCRGPRSRCRRSSRDPAPAWPPT